MTPEAVYLAAVLVLFLGAGLAGLVRLDLGAVILMLSLVVPWRPTDEGLRPILEVSEGFSGFGSPALVMVAAMFVLSAAMERTGAAQLLGARLLRAGARTEGTLQLTILFVATVFSAFVSDTTVVLVWMPLVLAAAREHGLSGSRLLMPLAAASLLGGQWTLIGTRSNLITSDYLRSVTGEGIPFFAFTPVAVAIWAACVVWFLLIGRRTLPRRPPEESLADRYDVTEYLTEVLATASADMVGQTLGSLRLGQRMGISVLGIVRGEEHLPPSPWIVVHPGDVLIVQGRISRISELLSRPGMEVREEMQLADKTLRSVDLRMVEALVAPGSALEGRTLGELDFLRRYRLSALAVARRGRPLAGRPLDQRLHFGDSLLLVGHEQMIERLRGEPSVFLLESRALPIANRNKAWLTIGWMALLVLLSVSRVIEPPVAVVLAAVGALLTGCLALREAYQAVDWRTLVLLGSMIPYGYALEKSGSAQALAGLVADLLGDLGPRAVLAGLCLVTIVLTQLIENAAVAVILAPIAHRLALSMDAQPLPFLLAMAICCSAGFATPFAHESTILVMAPGGYRPRHYVLAGLPFALLTWIGTVLVVPVLYPLAAG